MEGGCRLLGGQDCSSEWPLLTEGMVWREKNQDTNLEALHRDRNIQLRDTGWGMSDSIVVLQKKVCELELGCAGGSLAWFS